MSVEIQDLYPLSPLQQGMLFHALYSPESGMYVERLRYTIQGNLNLSAFERAWQQVIERHPILRSAFIWEDVDEPLQVVLEGIEVPLEVEDWRNLPAVEQQDKLEAYLRAVLERGFELSSAPLMQLKLIQMRPDLYEFIWSYHHLLLDGWSVSLILGELIASYEAFSRGGQPQLEKSRPYRDYIAWLKRQDQSRAEAFWRRTLKGFTRPISLGLNGKSSDLTAYEGNYEVLRIDWPKIIADKLEAFAREHRLTLNTVMQGAWALLLGRYSGEEDIVFGAVVSGRPAELAGSESMVGMFINTLPVRVQLSPQASLLSWLKELQEQQLEARQYEYNPLPKVQEWSELPRGLPLFESIMVFENKTLAVQLGQQEGSPEIRYSMHYATVTGYPLTVVVEPGPESLALGFTYDRRRFDLATVRQMQLHLRTLLEGILANPEQRISALPLLTEAERHQLVVQWNETEVAYPVEKCLHSLFEVQSLKTPEATALVFEKKKLTYCELNQRANQLARYLQRLGVGVEVLVGIYMERSLEMVTSLLGVLKAGGAYVPLDSAYPRERLLFMLEDSQAPVLLTQQYLVKDLEEIIRHSQSAVRKPVVVCVDAIEEKLAQESKENLGCGVSPDNIAYVIYTSGSTGWPKGVIVSHRAICNHMLWLRDHFALTEADIYLQKTPFSFDAAGTEFYAPLITGGRLVIARPGGHQDSAYLASMIKQHGVTILQLVPSLLRVLLDEPEFASCNSLRRVICAGEALPADLQDRFRACLDTELHNFYGPTEAAIDVTYWPYQHADSRLIVPIGRPIANTQIYLLDANWQLVPIGVPGELHIGGDNLARGYLNRPELTAEKFIPNPFSQKPGERLYKTGDLARYLPDGNIEYLGRIDHQVKLRGFRIELEEVEAVLRQHEAVRESVVITREDTPGNKRLVAYIVADLQAAPSIREWREFLKEKLPEYMVPSAFVLLEALPLTPNGKVDRRALPAPDGVRPGLEEDFVSPRTSIEERLAELWSQVLNVKQIGVHDNFFELGGDSILSIQIVGKAAQAGLRFTPKQLFQHPTIAELATVVDKAPAVEAEQGLVTGKVPLIPIQHWFFEQNLPNPNHFNHAIMLEVHQTVEATLLEQAVRHLLAHHDVLRSRFEPTTSGWQQQIVDFDEKVPFIRFDLSIVPDAEQSGAIEARATELQRSLNLSQGPLMRVALFELGSQKPLRLLILIHHLVVDGVSWRILLDDLMTAYQQLSQGIEVKLPPKTTAYKLWAEKLVEYAHSSELEQELNYWLGEAETEVTELPVDYPGGRDANTEISSQTVSVSLSDEETTALLREVPEAYHTQINDVLLTALVQTFAQWTGAHTLLIDLEGHGREAIFNDIDLSRTVGWFTSIFPVLLDLRRASGPGEALKSIKEQLRRIPQGGIGYGLLRYLSEDEVVRNRLRSLPQAEVSFNYLGQFDQILPPSSGLAPALEATGPVHDPAGRRRYLLEVNVFVSGGRLQMEWTYSDRVHRRATIERLAQNYLAQLRELIAHCLSPEAGGYTPSDFPLADLEQAKLDWLVGSDREIEDIYPLSPVQEGMLFYTLLAPGSGAYVTQTLYELEGLNIAAMKRAWQRVLDRHPILRTAFVWKGLDHPRQIVRRQVEVPFSQEDWRRYSLSEQKVRLERFLKEEQRQGFELSKAPLMRLNLFQVADNTYKLVWSYHHLLLDGWSVPLLLKEFLSLYEAFDKGQELDLERSRPYRDYIEWLQRQDLSQAELFWRQFLKGFTSPTPLSKLQSRAGLTVPGDSYTEQEIKLSEAMTAALQFFARKYQLTQSTLVQGSWSLLLCYYTGHEDVLFGATFSGRPAGLVGAETMIGLFINTLPVRVRLSLEEMVLPWLKALQNQQAELRQFENSPLSEVQRWSEMPQDMPMFESLIVFENFPIEGPHTIQDQGKGLKFVNTDFIIRNNFPFTVRAVPGQQLLLKVLYDTSRFDAATVDRTLKHLEALLGNIVAQPEARLAQLLERLAEADGQYQSMREEEFKKFRRQSLKNIKRKAISEEVSQITQQ